MIQLEWVFLLQLVIGSLLLLLLLRINHIQKQMDGIIHEVQKYVDFITEEETFIENDNYIEETRTGRDKEGQRIIKPSKKDKEEAQNHLIQAVLKEYFP